MQVFYLCGRGVSGAVHLLHHSSEEAAPLKGPPQAALAEAFPAPPAGARRTLESAPPCQPFSCQVVSLCHELSLQLHDGDTTSGA